MQYRKIFFILAAAAVSYLQAQEDSTSANEREQVVYQKPQPGENVSLVKTKFIQKLVLSFVNFKDDISDPSIVREIELKIKEVMPLTSNAAADQRTEDDVRKQVEEIVLKRFPVSDADYRAKVVEESNRKFRVYKHGEMVTIHYYSGRKTCVARGRFGQFNGRSVTINYKHVPFYDIVEEDKAHVSEEYAKIVQKKYIDNACKQYSRKKNELRSVQTARLRKEIENCNLNNGYILFNRKWLTAKEVMQQSIDAQIKLHPEIVRSKGTARSDAVVISTKKVSKERITNRVRRIKGQLIGKERIDVDSGCFDAIYWGFTREDVKFTLAKLGLKISTGSDYDIVYVTDRQLKNIRLSYVNNRLAKVEEVYAINDVNSIQNLKQALNTKYGQDDLEKQGKSSAAMASLTWTGQITKGTLKISIQGDNKIEAVTLIREPLNLKYLDWGKADPSAKKAQADSKKSAPAPVVEKKTVPAKD